MELANKGRIRGLTQRNSIRWRLFVLRVSVLWDFYFLLGTHECWTKRPAIRPKLGRSFWNFGCRFRSSPSLNRSAIGHCRSDESGRKKKQKQIGIPPRSPRLFFLRRRFFSDVGRSQSRIPFGDDHLHLRSQRSYFILFLIQTGPGLSTCTGIFSELRHVYFY